MRDPNRIIPVLDAVRVAWERNPDLRLGQLLVNAIRPRRACPEVFAAEDDRIVVGLNTAVAHPLSEPGGVTLTLTTDEALVLLGMLLRNELRKQLPLDAVEKELLSDMCGWLQNELGPVTDLAAVVDVAKSALSGS